MSIICSSCMAVVKNHTPVPGDGFWKIHNCINCDVQPDFQQFSNGIVTVVILPDLKLIRVIKEGEEPKVLDTISTEDWTQEEVSMFVNNKLKT